MTVGDMIRHLQQFDDRLPVCLADWANGDKEPSLSAAEGVALVEGWFEGCDSELIRDHFVQIG